MPIILGAVLLLLACLVVAGISPIEAGETLFQGSLGSARAISGTLRETTPLLIAGLSVFVALRGGLFNIGAEGQLIVGALAAAFIGLRFTGPVGLGLATLAGVLMGALWALPAGLIKAYRGGHEVITTIMLNNVAVLISTAIVAGPLKAPRQQGASTSLLSQSTMLQNIRLGELLLSPALLVGLLLVGLAAAWLYRSVGGFELLASGQNATAAEFAGIDVKRTTWRVMTASGALAGLAGALQVLAYDGRFYSGFSPGYGFDALGVALLAGTSPLALVPSALLFGALAKGGTAMGILGVPKGITTIVLGLVILSAAALRYGRFDRG